MKFIKIISATLFLLAFSSNCKAQLSDWFNKKKEELNQKVNDKINQKSSEAIDAAIDSPEKIIKKKIDKKRNKTEKTSAESAEKSAGNVADPPQSNNSQPIEVENEAADEDDTTTIQTNINCDSGKKKITRILKEQEGVTKVDINIKNGELKLVYSSDGTAYTTIIKLINENGFEADGNPPTSKKFNCK